MFECSSVLLIMSLIDVLVLCVLGFDFSSKGPLGRIKH